MTVPNLHETIMRMKAEVLYDMAVGTVPMKVSSFSELHDHVDANCYGGFCDDKMADALIAHFGGRDEHGGMPDGMLKFINDAQEAINDWLDDGVTLEREIEEYVYVQERAPAGNWVNRLGTREPHDALTFANAAKARGENIRVVVKTVTVIG